MLDSEKQQTDEFPSNLFLLVLITLSIIWILKKCFYKNPSNTNLPPSPPKLPILGNLHQLSPLTHRSFRSLGANHGPVMLLHFGSRPVIVVQSAGAACEIMKTHDLIFADKVNTIATRRIFYDVRDISTAPYGEYWRKMKSICILQLLSGKRVQSFGFIREEETVILMKKIDSCSSPVNLSELFDAVANDVVCRAAFGRKYSEGEAGRKFLMLLRGAMQLIGSVSIGEFIPCLSWINRVNGFDGRVEKAAGELDDFLENVIQEHLNDGLEYAEYESRDNFVDILLDIYKDNMSDVSIDREGIKAIILDILVGGTDTTSATLEWAMAEILRHPTVLNTLQTEVREILKDRHDITDADLGKMQYLKAVVRETLRLHPPIPISGRIAREDVKVMGYDIKSGMMILNNFWAIGRDPASWDEPEKFHPERFLNSSIDYKGVHFELIPFGAGRRGCPGIAFAMASVELVLANLMHKFEWRLPDGIELEDLDMTEMPGVTIHRKHPLYAVAANFVQVARL